MQQTFPYLDKDQLIQYTNFFIILKVFLALPEILAIGGIFLNNSSGFLGYYEFWFNMFNALLGNFG